MQKQLAILVLAFVGIGAFSRTANAAMMFGKQDDLTSLQKLDGEWKDKYTLGYRVQTLFIVAGVSVHDEGYVLLPVGKSNTYVAMTAEEIAKFQKVGLLPKELPHYKISFWQYLFGYSLWIVLGFVAVCSIFGAIFKKKQPAPAPGAAPPTPENPTTGV